MMGLRSHGWKVTQLRSGPRPLWAVLPALTCLMVASALALQQGNTPCSSTGCQVSEKCHRRGLRIVRVHL